MSENLIYVLSVVGSGGNRKPVAVYKDYDLARKDITHIQKENAKVCLSLQTFELQEEVPA